MALPPRRHSKQRGRKRRTHWKLKGPTLIPCPQCKQLKISHRVCPNCGFYKAREAVKIEKKQREKKKRPS
jgi:large subunit ribosomal protein L32